MSSSRKVFTARPVSRRVSTLFFAVEMAGRETFQVCLAIKNTRKVPLAGLLLDAFTMAGWQMR
jgi:hypothetical protein